MPLLYENKPVELFSWMSDFYIKYPALHEAALEFVKQPKQETVDLSGFIYVGQREWTCTLPSHGTANVLGSTDATTCHYLIVRHTGSGAVALGHFDGSSVAEGVNAMVAEVVRLSNDGPPGRFEVSLVGGFLDERNISTQLSQDLTEALSKNAHELHLLLHCLTDANTRESEAGEVYPIVYDIIVDVDTGRVRPATLSSHHKQPCLALRSAINFAGTCDKMRNLFDSASGVLTVQPTSFRADATHFKAFLGQGNDFFLQNFSTSPEQEPESFAKEMRATFEMMRDHPEPLKSLFKNGGLRYRQRESVPALEGAGDAPASGDTTVLEAGCWQCI